MFGNVFEGIWWVIIIIFIIGYGDFVLIIMIGRLVVIILVLIGMGFIIIYFVMFFKIVVFVESVYLEGNLKFYGKDYFIVVGWNECVKFVLEFYCDVFYKEDIVFIDDFLIKNFMICDCVYFIKGSFFYYEVLEFVNVWYVKKVLIIVD